MAAATYDIEIEQGSKFVWHVGFDDSDGVLVDLNGYGGQMQVRKGHGSTDTLLDLSFGAGIEFGSFASAGEIFNIRVTILATATSLIPPGPWVYDLEVSPGGVVDDTIRIVEGTATISPEVTR